MTSPEDQPPTREEEAAATAAVDCPRCHQPAGSTCHASDGTELPTPPSDVTAHWARVLAYRENQQ